LAGVGDVVQVGENQAAETVIFHLLETLSDDDKQKAYELIPQGLLLLDPVIHVALV